MSLMDAAQSAREAHRAHFISRFAPQERFLTQRRCAPKNIEVIVTWVSDTVFIGILLPSLFCLNIDARGSDRRFLGAILAGARRDENGSGAGDEDSSDCIGVVA